jgi:hypothetical protein
MSPALDQLPDNRSERRDVNVLEGALTERRGARWAIVDGAAALLGPLVGADAVGVGERVCVAISQDGTPFVVYPGGGGDCCSNVDGGHPDTIFGAACNVDGNGVVLPTT